MQCLIVDQSGLMRGFIRRTIVLSGLPVTRCFEAESGDQALIILCEQQIDFTICEVHLPGLEGEHLVRFMKADERLRSIPILVVSADSTAFRMETMLGLGVDAYLAKPFAPELLGSQLEKMLEMVAGRSQSAE